MVRIRFDTVELARPGFSLSADVAVAAEASVAVIGPSGAGKSTLLGLLAGFVPPSAGRIYIGDTDVTAIGPAQRPVTILFQDNNLFPHLTLVQNVGLGRNPGLRLGQEDHRAVAAVLERVGLDGLTEARPAELSGGQQSRAALARALLRNHPVLLLDEPFAALGPALRRDMLDLVAQIRVERKMTLLMVTHDPTDAARISESVIFVSEGRAEPPQPTAALMDAPSPALAAYLGL